MLNNYGEDSTLCSRKKQLDKDLLFKGNKIYSPETCVFVIGKLNTFILEGTSKGHKYLTGASRHIKDAAKGEGAPFIGRCSNPFDKSKSGGKKEFCKVFDTEIEAHNYWRECKHSLAQRYIALPCTPEKLKPMLESKWSILKEDGVY